MTAQAPQPCAMCRAGAAASRRHAAASRSQVCPASHRTCLAGLPPPAQVQGLLERTATCGLDWDSCCVYRISEEGGAAVEAQVRAAPPPSLSPACRRCCPPRARCQPVQPVQGGVRLSKGRLLAQRRLAQGGPCSSLCLTVSPPINHTQPPYPVSCTAAYHAAQVQRDVLIAQDYPAQ
jgi:hypothetical protein